MAEAFVGLVDATNESNRLAITAAGALKVDSSGSPGGTVTANQGTANTNANGWPTKITDGSNIVSVFQFHNTDNQALGTVYGLNTGGVAQMVNATGNLDRQRGTTADVASGMGVATGTQQLAWPVTIGPVTSGAITGSGTAQTITVTNATGSVNGVTWTLGVGSTLVLDTNTSTQEAFTITAVNVGSKTVTGVIKNNHNASAPSTAFFYDQARSAMIPDGSTGQGISAGGTYLFNSSLNSGNGGWEAERSAAGERDGASGTGTNIAAAYEHNSGGPALASGLASNLQFDRERNLQGKGSQTQTITSTTTGNTSVVFSSAAATDLVEPGGPLTLSGGATQEVVYVTAAFVPGSSATVPLQSPVVNNGQTTARFDIFAAQGPQLNPFTPTGLSIDGLAFYSPNLGLYQQLRAGDTDGIQATQVPAESAVLWNGSTFDRWRSSASTGVALVNTGTTTASTTLNAVTANTTGTTVDAGGAQSNWCAVAVATGSPTAGTVTLELSMDNVSWVSSSVTASITAAGNFLLASTGRAARYARVSLTGLTGSITLTVKMMAAG